ncbi:hypothetical protein WMF28_10380 [Sorangium sp. So ce590]|uniref:hypothetical protein n=1 Tax=Sorangium sp. So ce590 TaxID=3133317 RepID=UPI003F5FFF01
MAELQEGLTATYNLLKDPARERPGLTQLHEEIDRAVLAAYGFDDIEAPPYTAPAIPGETQAWGAFEDQAIDRLFALNEERAAEERRHEHAPSLPP